MSDLDAFIRGAAIGVAFLIALVLWRTRHHNDIGWMAPLCSAGFAGYLLWGHPLSLGWPPLLRVVLAILALSPPFWFWALARSIFEDGFRLRPAHWLWLALVEAAGLAQFVLRADAPRWLLGLLGFGFRAAAIGLVAQALWVVWRDRPADLVESRARLRVVLVLSVGAVTILGLVAALLFRPSVARPLLVQIGGATVLLVMSVVAGMLALRADSELLPPRSDTRAPGSHPLDAAADPMAAALAKSRAEDDIETSTALARLHALMRRDEVWRETGLTIGDLAARAQLPEYRLRRLINQRLGFRNFVAFLNEYRLAAAADRLADQNQLRTPILTIALDLGWGSIGPFNRAFRARFAMSPSDYRRERMRSTPPERSRAQAGS